MADAPLLDASRCRVVRLIGRGGFAEVYVVKLNLHERGHSTGKAALKLLRPVTANRDDAERMFLGEARASVLLQHSNLVRCLGLYRVPAHFPGVGPLPEATWGMLLEYCEGGTLRDRVTASMRSGRRSYSDEATLGWLLDVAEALRFLHAATPPLIHRDIKAENVLLKAEGAGAGAQRGAHTAKLADMGLHVQVEDDRAVMLRRRATTDGASFVAITPAASECPLTQPGLTDEDDGDYTSEEPDGADGFQEPADQDDQADPAQARSGGEPPRAPGTSDGGVDPTCGDIVHGNADVSDGASHAVAPPLSEHGLGLLAAASPALDVSFSPRRLGGEQPAGPDGVGALCQAISCALPAQGASTPAPQDPTLPQPPGSANLPAAAQDHQGRQNGGGSLPKEEHATPPATPPTPARLELPAGGLALGAAAGPQPLSGGACGSCSAQPATPSHLPGSSLRPPALGTAAAEGSIPEAHAAQRTCTLMATGALASGFTSQSLSAPRMPGRQCKDPTGSPPAACEPPSPPGAFASRSEAGCSSQGYGMAELSACDTQGSSSYAVVRKPAPSLHLVHTSPSRSPEDRAADQGCTSPPAVDVEARPSPPALEATGARAFVPAAFGTGSAFAAQEGVFDDPSGSSWERPSRSPAAGPRSPQRASPSGPSTLSLLLPGSLSLQTFVKAKPPSDASQGSTFFSSSPDAFELPLPPPLGLRGSASLHTALSHRKCVGNAGCSAAGKGRRREASSGGGGGGSKGASSCAAAKRGSNGGANLGGRRSIDLQAALAAVGVRPGGTFAQPLAPLAPAARHPGSAERPHSSTRDNLPGDLGPADSTTGRPQSASSRVVTLVAAVGSQPTQHAAINHHPSSDVRPADPVLTTRRDPKPVASALRTVQACSPSGASASVACGPVALPQHRTYAPPLRLRSPGELATASSGAGSPASAAGADNGASVTDPGVCSPGGGGSAGMWAMPNPSAATITSGGISGTSATASPAGQYQRLQSAPAAEAVHSIEQRLAASRKGQRREPQHHARLRQSSTPGVVNMGRLLDVSSGPSGAADAGSPALATTSCTGASPAPGRRWRSSTLAAVADTAAAVTTTGPRGHLTPRSSRHSQLRTQSRATDGAGGAGGAAAPSRSTQGVTAPQRPGSISSMSIGVMREDSMLSIFSDGVASGSANSAGARRPSSRGNLNSLQRHASAGMEASAMQTGGQRPSTGRDRNRRPSGMYRSRLGSCARPASGPLPARGCAGDDSHDGAGPGCSRLASRNLESASHIAVGETVPRPSDKGLVNDDAALGASPSGEEVAPLPPSAVSSRAANRQASGLLDSGRLQSPHSVSRSSLAANGGGDGAAADAAEAGAEGTMLLSPGSFRRHMRRVRSISALFRSTDGALPEHSEFQWVYGLTGRAGSCMYMAPEVFMRQPYNAKCDVFSFGVLMYELWSHELLLYAYQNNARAARLGIREPQDYAQKVSEGFRPPRPHRFSDAQWDLVSRCWHQDPCERPSMAEVAERLRQMQEAYATARVPIRNTRLGFCRTVGQMLGSGAAGDIRGGGNSASPSTSSQRCGCGCTIS